MLFFAKQAVALVLMAGVALYLSAQFNWVTMQAHQFYRILALAGVLIACMVTYFASLFAMGFRFRDFKRIEN